MPTTYVAQIVTAAGRVPHGITPEELTPQSAAGTAVYTAIKHLLPHNADAIPATFAGATLEVYSVRRTPARQVLRDLVSKTPLGAA
jgi:hypothetical protein